MLRVLVVDDSPTARALLAAILSNDDEMTIVGEANSGPSAVEMTAQLRPDVITMDIHMPGMSGFDATKQIMIDTPTPIVIVSASTMEDEVASGMRALRAGALTVLRKPPGPEAANYEEACSELVETVRSMADVKVVRHFRPSQPEIPLATTEGTGSREPANEDCSVANRGDRVLGPGVCVASDRGIVAIAASTGGPPAIQQVLANLPADFPLPILIVQHIAKGFSDGFAQWLNSTVALPVMTAQAGVPLSVGRVYVAPEERHLGVSRSRAIEISDSPPIAGFRPSASYLFNSVAGVYRDATLAVIMTGMGSDGLDGLRVVKQCGGTVIAQDQASSVVFGMPGAALRAKIVDDTVGLDQIAGKILQFELLRTSR
ncbi:MAG: chemotaxis-specific protein-glutamate methyltransferase CheB [Pirellulaceae bacterium]|jgi:two-component system chemotaxis response regulator CheB|nr:chemotaxis-specific protein-glutamate methyltransferase CheB [Pirellulaceae bacterium]HJN13590.1 chemotaxis-specific protein-glutamate methyltransferase CheB [Pirellulaceae bacterium]